MTDRTMGQRIAAQRKKLGISQESLGDKVGVSRQAISKWEADGAVPEIDKLIALSKLFGVSVGWLLGVEEQPEKQSDELTESQLKMVEEIVKRYKTEPAPKQMHKALLGSICLVLLALTVAITVWLFRGSSDQDYSHQISNLEAGYANVQSQLATLSSRIGSMSTSIEEAASPLSGYRFWLKPNNEAAAVTVSIEAVPKAWNADTAAMLYVRLDGAQYLSAPFQWDGSAYVTSVDVAYDDGYEYWMVLQAPEGTQESVQLTDTNAQYPQSQYAVTCEVTVGTSHYYKDRDLLGTSGFEVHLRQPDASAYNNWGNVDWEYTEWVLYHIRGDQREIVFTDSCFQSTGDTFTETWCYLNTDLPLPELQEGDGLELWCRAGLTNGLKASTHACSWAYVNGELIQSEPVS